MYNPRGFTYTESFVNPLDSPYGRRGSFFAFANNTNGWDMYGKCTLWLCNTRINFFAMTDMNANNGFRQLRIEIVRDGKVLPALIYTTTEEVVLACRYGEVRFVIAERKLALAKCTAGLSLRIGTPSPGGGFFAPAPKDMEAEKLDNGYVLPFSVSKIFVAALKGEQKINGPVMDITPDANGELLVAFEDWMTDPKPRTIDKYPAYEAGVASVKADFDEFCRRVCPSLPAAYEPMRLQSLWQTWNMIVEPDGESDYKRSMVKMVHSIFEAAFVWQQPMQAIWLSNDLDLAWTVFLSGFDNQEENGRLIDALSYKAGSGGMGLKPPVHGMALLWLMENKDLSNIPLTEKEQFWEGLRKWTEYFINNRDVDNDGVIEYAHILETGWEDAPCYNVGFPCASPELNGFVALCMEALAKFGRTIGKPAAVCDDWEAKSKALIGKITEKFWDGEKWFAFNAETGNKSDSTTLALYCVLALGDRLPKDVVEKSIAFMYGPDGFDTPHSLATEAPTSDYFKHGFTAGSVMVPGVFLAVMGLEACGRTDLAKDAAMKYCNILRDYGMFHINNALTGVEDRSLTAFGEPGLFWSAWASSCYFWMAEKYGA